MFDFCIIGSGISGSTIANFLSKRYSVQILDKARGPGGRASNKRFKDNLSFDHGVQYISPKTEKFKNFINQLNKKKILKIWDGNHLDFTFEKKDNNQKFIGRCPFPQLKILAKKFLDKKILNLKVDMEPNITTMIAVKNQKDIPISSIKFNDDILAWVAYENSKKRFRSSVGLWTIQSTVKWAKKKINIYKINNKVENLLISKFINFTGVKKNKIIFKKTHGWKYSYNSKGSPYKSYWDRKTRIGVCADWFIGSKVESAWLSANDLAKKIMRLK